MAFTDDDIRAMVETAQYSDPRVTEYLSRILAQRRDTIGKTYFAKVLPLDSFRVERGELRFEDLAARYGFRRPLPLLVSWSRFDNEKSIHTPLPMESSFQLPAEFAASHEGTYFAARIHPQDLAAKRDGVVEEALIGVQLDGPLIVAHRRRRVTDLEVEVADPVIQREVGGRVLPGLDLLDGLEVDLDGLPPILLLLELPRGVLKLLEAHAVRAERGNRR